MADGLCRRITKDVKEVESLTMECGCSSPTMGADVFNWEVSLTGPLGTPYEGGRFLLRIRFPSNYPFDPPELTFATKIFHPFVSSTGQICVDALGRFWSPVLTLRSVLMSLRYSLMEVDVRMEDGCLNEAAAWQLLHNPARSLLHPSGHPPRACSGTR